MMICLRGPIVIATDESGSMNLRTRTGNTRREEAKALGVALANLAHLQGRWFGAMSWSAAKQVRSWTVPPRAAEYPQRLVEFAGHFYNGGTYLPLDELRELVDEACRGGLRPDIVLITDGDVPRQQPEIESFLAWRKRRDVRLFGIAIATPSPLLEYVSTNYYLVPDLGFDQAAITHALGIK